MVTYLFTLDLYSQKNNTSTAGFILRIFTSIMVVCDGIWEVYRPVLYMMKFVLLDKITNKKMNVDGCCLCGKSLYTPVKLLPA